MSNRITVSSKMIPGVGNQSGRHLSCKGAELSNKICEVFINEGKSLAKIDNVNIVDTAEIQNTVKPQPVLYTA